MKKMNMLFALMVMMTMGSNVKAESLLDQFYFGFVGHAKFAIESTTEGTSKPEFLDNFVEIGKVNGDHIAALDFGVGGTILPDTAQYRSAEWSTGGKIHLAPLIRAYVNLPEQWSFLRTLEIDARASYNWTEHHPFYGLVAAYAFK